MTNTRSKRLRISTLRKTNGHTISSRKSPMYLLVRTAKKPKYALFSQVALRQDFPEHNLKRGSVATVVERYNLNGKYGYSLEGFDLPNITLEVDEEQISALAPVKGRRSQKLVLQQP